MSGPEQDWVGFVSIGLAVMALLVSAFSAYNSRRALRISQEQEKRRIPILLPHLLNSFIKYNEGRSERYYVFLVSISNPQDNDNSIAFVELIIEYSRKESPSTRMRLDLDSSRDIKIKELQGAPLLAPPIRLDAHQSTMGWMVFKISKDLYNELSVKRYEIEITDSHKRKCTIEPVILTERMDEDVQKK